MMIEGYDIDKIASEDARLSLLLYSLPYGNKWDFHAGDLLRISKSKIKEPFVILGNPPYIRYQYLEENQRSEGQSAAALCQCMERWYG